MGYIDAAKAPYYVKADNKTDNSVGLLKLQKDISVSKQHHDILLPGPGIILSSFNRWLFGAGTYHAFGDDVKLQSLYTGNDEALKRGLWLGEMMQNNVLEYNGTKIYVVPDEVESAIAGNRFFTLKKIGKYKIGDRIHINAGDLFAGGYPRAAREFDWYIVIAVKGKVIFIDRPLEETFIGSPICVNLDRKEHVYGKFAEFSGITFGGNFATPPAEKVIMNNCRVDEWLWISEAEQVYTNNVWAKNVEPDKLVRKWVDNGLVTPGSPVNGGSIRTIQMNNATTGILRLCPRYLTLNNPIIIGDEVIKNEDRHEYDYYVPCIANAPANNVIRELVINNPTFISSGRHLADFNLEYAPYQKTAVQTDGNDILMSLELAATLEKGMKLFNENGTNSGVVTAVMPEGTYHRVIGNWNTPTPGEVFMWSPVMKVIDSSKHNPINKKQSYGDRSIRFQGNAVDEPPTIHLTQDDFPGKNRQIDVYGFITSIESHNVPNGIELQNVDPYGKIPLDFNGKKWVKQLYLIGSGDKFEINIRYESY